ncbi:hypothetical protein LTR02_016481 [Friedmanniomyces endolithicus]|nr:hypothetical protein LTR02_016481 [Friedmanniomyces endolithicus]
MKQYWKLLQTPIKSELDRMDLTPDINPGAAKYACWLHDFQKPLFGDQKLYEVSELAYNTRHSEFLRVDFDPVTGQPVLMENTSRTSIRHYVGRLCAPKRAAKLLIYAAASHPHIFCGFAIRRQNPGPVLRRPDLHAGLTLAGISGRMFPSNSADLIIFREGLQMLEEKGSIMSRVLEHYRSKDWRPRIHAELTLLEALHDSRCMFFGNDKYIACSKPACFCCYHYIGYHSGSFIRPPCHNKVYINWQPPNLVTDTSHARALGQRDVINKVTQEVRRAIVERVLNTRNNMRWHPDSSTGITPLRDRGSRTGTQLGYTRDPSMSSVQGRSSRDKCSQTDAGSSGGEESEDGARGPSRRLLDCAIPTAAMYAPLLRPPSSRDNFEISVICALPEERDTVEALMTRDVKSEGRTYRKARGDDNAYTSGVLGGKPVVLVAPRDIGTTNTRDLARGLRINFPNILYAFVVGIAGGAPFVHDGKEWRDSDIHLGDVIVSTHVIEYDFGRE